MNNGTRFAARLWVIASALVAATAGNALAQSAGYAGEKVVRVEITGPADHAAIENLGAEAWECRPRATGPSDYRLPKGKLEALEATGLRFRVMIDDLQAVAEAEAARLASAALEGAPPPGPNAWFTEYKSYDAISAYVNDLTAAFPGVATRIELGNSLQGRPIFGVRIAAPGAPADRTAVLLHGLQHAREWITGMTCVYLADRLARGHESDPRIAEMLGAVQFIIVPVVNPDGYVYTWASPSQRFWRKNRRPNPNGTTGVDLNRNWGFGWGGAGASTNQGSETYRGASAFSEPETQVLRNYIIANPHIRAHVDIHSYSQLILSSWGYTADLPPQAALFADLNEVMRVAFASPHGTAFIAGPTYTTIYPASGVSSDWTHGDRGILGWGFELRDRGQFGFALPPDQIIPTGEETFEAVSALAEAVGRPLRFTFPDGVPMQVEADTAKEVRVMVSPMAQVVAPGSPIVRTRIGRTSEFETVPLTLVDGTNYAATLPGAPCGAEIAFSFQASSIGGQVVTAPEGTTVFVAIVGAPEGAQPCPPCPADFNRDGFADPDDLGDFVNCYFATPPCATADVNADGNIDPDDLGDFINTYFAGCP